MINFQPKVWDYQKAIDTLLWFLENSFTIRKTSSMGVNNGVDANSGISQVLSLFFIEANLLYPLVFWFEEDMKASEVKPFVDDLLSSCATGGRCEVHLLIKKWVRKSSSEGE